MCGIIGAFGTKNIVAELLDGLLAIQHRGQDAAGITTYNGHFHTHKGAGLVRDVFKDTDFSKFQSDIGLGHVRYPTVGLGSAEDAQPFIVNSPFGIAMAHNGNVTNFSELKKELFEQSFRQLNSECDVEVILNVFADELRKQELDSFTPEDAFSAVEGVFRRVKGSYSVITVIAGKGFLAFRDPYGIRPIIMGQRKDNGMSSYMFCSENAVFNMLGYEALRDVRPGEAIFIDNDRKVHIKQIREPNSRPCVFEYIYFARPDSMIDDVSVYKTRLRLGKKLAKRWKKVYPDKMPDVVAPVPDSARAAAMEFANALDVPYREALIKNRYVNRTFIMPDQTQRSGSVLKKLSPIPLEIEGKRVAIVDDSIVRGTTSKKIVKMLKDSGAKEVYFLVSSAPLKYPCVYGIDMSTKKELIAMHKDEEEVRKMIGADILLYQDLEDMIDAAGEGTKKVDNFCSACFSGDYPTGDVTKEMLIKIENERLDAQCKAGTQ